MTILLKLVEKFATSLLQTHRMMTFTNLSLFTCFRNEKDVKALYGISYDDSSLMNAKKHAMSNGTLRAYSSSENITEDEADHVQPDQVIRVYKADHTSKYFVIYQVSKFCLLSKL